MGSSRDHTLMEMAALWSNHSTCSRLEVGAVISRDGRSLSSGYNGAPRGLPHCDHSYCICDPILISSLSEKEYQGDPECPQHGACRTAVHAELNAIAFAAKNGVATDGAEIHTTHQPCLNCSMAIINAGIIRVVYLHPYRDPAGTDLLAAAGVTALKAVR